MRLADFCPCLKGWFTSQPVVGPSIESRGKDMSDLFSQSVHSDDSMDRLGEWEASLSLNPQPSEEPQTAQSEGKTGLVYRKVNKDLHGTE